MIRMTINVRHGVLIALSAIFAASAATAADAPATSEVTVQAERPTSKVVGRDATGAPEVLVEVRHRVTYSDLDLAIPSNAKVLKTRVHDAAYRACADLDTLYPIPTAGGSETCVQKAEQRAMPLVLSAIAAAESRKTAAD
jgi:UrcA family protein